MAWNARWRRIDIFHYYILFYVNPANQSSFIFLETKIFYLQNIGEFHGRNVSRRVLSNEFTVHDSTYRSLRNTILSFEREEWKGFQRFFSMRLHVSRHSSISSSIFISFILRNARIEIPFHLKREQKKKNRCKNFSWKNLHRLKERERGEEK